MSPGATPGYEAPSRTMIVGAMNVGHKTLSPPKTVAEASGRGREFTPVSAADMLLTATASHNLERALQSWRSSSLQVNDSDGSVGTKYRARNFALEYLATVTGTEYAQVPWAEQFARSSFLMLTTRSMQE